MGITILIRVVAGGVRNGAQGNQKPRANAPKQA